MAKKITIGSTRGRPRDPLVEERTLQAAAQVYGRHGWPGFSFDAVAREAAVGKSTLYSRWADAGELLAHLIEHRWQALGTINTGSLEEDLPAFCRLVLARYRETGGGIAWHLRRDILSFPELADQIGQAVHRTTSLCLDILRRARERGELREGISLSLTAEILTSALENFAVRNVHDVKGASHVESDYVARLTQILRHGIEQV